MKVLVTGAHFTVAQAVIEELAKFPNIEIVYVGRKYTREGDRTASVESEIIPMLGIRYRTITTGRIQRSLSFYTIPSLLKIPIGFLQALWILFRERPTVILSFGGYVAVPIVITGWLLSIPIIIHEQTLVSGLANTVSSWFANKIAISFESDLYSFNSSKMVLTGNPIRKQLLSVRKKSSEIEEFIKSAREQGRFVIYITGGNQGSHIINEVVWSNLREILKSAYVIHQTGDSEYRDFERLSEEFKDLEGYMVKKWFDVEEVAEIFSKVDLVVSRGGINTLSELAYFGVPAIVIPVPYIYKSEQLVNAKYFSDLGLCRVLEQKDMKERFLAEIQDSLLNIKDLTIKAKGAKKVINKDAAKMIAQEVLLLGND